MSFEIESKFRLADEGQALKARLEGLGATGGRGFIVSDTYLKHPSRDFAITGEAFRIRREAGRNCLTYKGPKSKSEGVKSRAEIEFEIAEGDGTFEQARAMMTSLGFTAVLTVEKFRTPFQLHYQGHDVTVVIDNAHELGHFAEVELVVATPGDQPRAEAMIKAVAAALGLAEYEPRSYLKMWLERLTGGTAGGD